MANKNVVPLLPANVKLFWPRWARSDVYYAAHQKSGVRCDPFCPMGHLRHLCHPRHLGHPRHFWPFGTLRIHHMLQVRSCHERPFHRRRFVAHASAYSQGEKKGQAKEETVQTIFTFQEREAHTQNPQHHQSRICPLILVRAWISYSDFFFVVM